MSVLKQYNQATSEWEAVAIGKQGPSGTVAVTSPLTNSGTSTAGVIGINYAALQDGKNLIINGGFDIAQRGTVAHVGGGYSLDRWYLSSWGSASATSVSQQTSGTPVGSRYHMRVTYGASGGYGNMFHYIESANVIPLAGKTVTLSFKIRRSSSWTASTFLSTTISKNSTVDAGPASSGWNIIFSSIETPTSSIPTGTGASDWLTVTTTFVVPNDGSANSLAIQFSEQAVGGAGAYYEVAQVQLEVGSVATPFKRHALSIEGELAACQRYYYRSIGTTAYALHGSGSTVSTTSARICIVFPVSMRSVPTAVEYSTLACGRAGIDAYSVSALSIVENGTNTILLNVTSSNLPSTGGYVVLTSLGNAAGYIGFSAEQ